MKKKIWLIAATAGMLLSLPNVDAKAVVKVQIGTRVAIGSSRGHHHHRRYAEVHRFREERRHRHDIDYRRHHQRRRSGVTIKIQ
jgi:hypothetical protein